MAESPSGAGSASDNRASDSTSAKPSAPAQADDDRAVEFARASLARARASARTLGRSTFRGRSRWANNSNDPIEPIFSGPGPDDRDPALVAALAQHIVAQRGWTTQLNLAAVAGRWPNIVGADIAAHTVVETFEVVSSAGEGAGAQVTLVVRADSSAWATQLRVLAATLQRRLLDELPAGSQVELRILGPSAPTWRHGARHVPGRGPRDTYG